MNISILGHRTVADTSCVDKLWFEAAHCSCKAVRSRSRADTLSNLQFCRKRAATVQHARNLFATTGNDYIHFTNTKHHEVGYFAATRTTSSSSDWCPYSYTLSYFQKVRLGTRRMTQLELIISPIRIIYFS
jgi:hypothetical protein